MPTADSIDDGRLPIMAADAATTAARDAEAAAQSAAGTTSTAREAAATATDAAVSARHATATVVAAAASTAADLAARAAAAVRAEADTQALNVAASAVTARQAIESDLPADVDLDEARRVAASVAATVAADATTQAKLTDEAAARVAEAVRLAAEVAALDALVAASIVELAAGTAEKSAHVVVGSSAGTAAASNVAVESIGRVTKFALDRIALLRHAPMVVELQRALENAELRLYYQPMYSMRTGALVAVEALLRWQHPDRGLLPPSEFLDAAEGPQLVTPIGDWVLETAVRQAATWQQAHGGHAPRVWVNISCEQLGGNHLVGVVQRLLSQTGLAPNLLGLEVTERQLAGQVDEIANDLLAMRALGVSLAVDDFGTGYASLDYLRRFTFDEIKIDRSFVSVHNRTNEAVTSSIIALGRSLDLTVVAEGIETQDQYDRLKLLGCAVAQGYLLHRPAAAETISDHLAKVCPVPALTVGG